MLKYASLLPVFLIVVGCASTNNYPSNPTERINFHVRYANQYAEEKKYGVVAYHLNELLSIAGGADRVKTLLASDSDLRNGLTNYLCKAEGAIETKDALIKSMRLVTDLDNKKLWDGVPGCRSRLNEIAANTSSNKFLWTVEDNVLEFDSLSGDVKQKKLIRDSFDYFASKNKYLVSSGNYVDLASNYADYLGGLKSEVQHLGCRKVCRCKDEARTNNFNLKNA